MIAPFPIDPNKIEDIRIRITKYFYNTDDDNESLYLYNLLVSILSLWAKEQKYDLAFGFIKCDDELIDHLLEDLDYNAEKIKSYLLKFGWIIEPLLCSATLFGEEETEKRPVIDCNVEGIDETFYTTFLSYHNLEDTSDHNFNDQKEWYYSGGTFHYVMMRLSHPLVTRWYFLKESVIDSEMDLKIKNHLAVMSKPFGGDTVRHVTSNGEIYFLEGYDYDDSDATMEEKYLSLELLISATHLQELLPLRIKELEKEGTCVESFNQ